MALNNHKPTTPGLRHRIDPVNLTTKPVKKVKKLLSISKNRAGRNNSGKITVRHRGGRQKRFLRLVDFKRNVFEVPAKVASIEYDPGRTANVALLHYQNGDKRYILAPKGLKVGDTVISTQKEAEIETGNTMPLRLIPVGTPIHNIELTPGKGGQIVRSAGSSAQIQDKEGAFVNVKLPSGEIRRIKAEALATIGQVSREDHKNTKLGKAGRKRLMGWRPQVRGVAMHPGAHPHGGGEGRSGIGMKSPKSPWGKKTLGKRTRKAKKYSDKFITKSRKKKN